MAGKELAAIFFSPSLKLSSLASRKGYELEYDRFLLEVCHFRGVNQEILDHQQQ